MTKIEEKALDAYPIYTAENIDDVIKARKLFIKGYYQALEDVKKEIDAQLSLLTEDNDFQKGRWTELNHIRLFIDNLKK